MTDFEDSRGWQTELHKITNDGRLNEWIEKSRVNGWTFREKMPVTMAIKFWNLIKADPEIGPVLHLANEFWIKGDDGFDPGKDSIRLIKARAGIDLILYFMRWFGWMKNFPPASSTHAIRIVSAGVALDLQTANSSDSDQFYATLLSGNGGNWFAQSDGENK